MSNLPSPPAGEAKKKSGAPMSRALGGNSGQETSKNVAPNFSETGGRKRGLLGSLAALLTGGKSQKNNGAGKTEPHELTSGQAVGIPGGQDPTPTRETQGNEGDTVTGTDGEQVVKAGELESSQKVTPPEEVEQQNLEIRPVLEEGPQENGSRSTSTRDSDIDASGSTYGGHPVDKEQPGYNPVALVIKHFIQKKAADDEIETLKKRNKDLEEQIARAENQNSRAHAAHGVYSRSEADPGLLQKVATDIKQSLSSFTAILTDHMDSELKASFHPTGVKFQRVGDIKFAIQAQLSSLVFEGLWDTDEHFFYKCLPEYADLEKSQEAQFTRYEHMKALGASGVFETRLDGSSCSEAKCKDACTCGLMEFVEFFNAKYKSLTETELGNCSANKVELKEEFLGLLSNVWLAHLLTLSFEQPSTLFKVRRGRKFVRDYMDPVMEAEESGSDEPMIHTVAFMIMPGFRVGKSFIKSVVYLESAGTATQC